MKIVLWDMTSCLAPRAQHIRPLLAFLHSAVRLKLCGLPGFELRVLLQAMLSATVRSRDCMKNGTTICSTNAATGMFFEPHSYNVTTKEYGARMLNSGPGKVRAV